jgi:hypothetical protein
MFRGLGDRRLTSGCGGEIRDDRLERVDVDPDDAPPARAESGGTGGADTRRGAGDDDRSVRLQRAAP